MSETHPNALRMEASDKRKQANQLNAEADALESRANSIDPQEDEDQTPKKKKLPDGPYKPKKNADWDSDKTPEE